MVAAYVQFAPLIQGYAARKSCGCIKCQACTGNYVQVIAAYITCTTEHHLALAHKEVVRKARAVGGYLHAAVTGLLYAVCIIGIKQSGRKLQIRRVGAIILKSTAHDVEGVPRVLTAVVAGLNGTCAGNHGHLRGSCRGINAIGSALKPHIAGLAVQLYLATAEVDGGLVQVKTRATSYCPLGTCLHVYHTRAFAPGLVIPPEQIGGNHLSSGCQANGNRCSLFTGEYAILVIYVTYFQCCSRGNIHGTHAVVFTLRGIPCYRSARHIQCNGGICGIQYQRRLYLCSGTQVQYIAIGKCHCR